MLTRHQNQCRNLPRDQKEHKQLSTDAGSRVTLLETGTIAMGSLNILGLTGKNNQTGTEPLGEPLKYKPITDCELEHPGSWS